jgi:hypothetical protein
LLTAKPLSNGAGAGFDAYVYPQWSTIVGWCIFVACIIPIPLVFIVNYFQEYFALARRETVSFWYSIFSFIIIDLIELNRQNQLDQQVVMLFGMRIIIWRNHDI